MKCDSNVAAFMLLVGFCLPVKYACCQSNEAQTQPAQIKRLILMDGSFELISQYSIQGDRVRYFSAERYVWEELPYSLVDWTATEQYARQAANDASGRMNDALAKASEEKKEEDARMPLVAPGLRLPSSEGVFLLDVYQGKSALNSLAQNEADLKKNTRGNILRGVLNPVASSKQTVELKGLHARIQSHDLAPAVYFSVNSADPPKDYNADSAKDHLRIVRCENKKGDRVVATYEIAIYGKVKQRAKFIEAKIEPISDYWVKITPSASLKPGEYALVELDSKGTMNMYVWDFGANPAAPPNPDIDMANPERKEPVLIQKPRNKVNYSDRLLERMRFQR